MKTAIELLERSLGFISWMKYEQGETVDVENLEGKISAYLDLMKIDAN